MVLNKSYFPKTFWILTVLKLICGSMFASHYVMNGFLPFITYFIYTGGNPYEYFFSISQTVFPYPSGMLLFISPLFLIGNIVTDIFSHTFLSLFLLRIPILFADIVIYIILCKLLPSKENKILWLYYASPILFYINYYHGQLDVIPTALLMLSLYFLSIKKYFNSYILLGIGIATKTHLLITLPFYIIYLIKQKKHMVDITLLPLVIIIVFLSCNLPFFNHAYFSTVFNNVEQQRLFFAFLPYNYKELGLLIAPAALLVCFYVFAANKRVNFDSLILTLGLVFTILIALVPPMQGWFYWSIPLFTFFLIKYKDSHLLSFVLMNIFFLAFFIVTKDSDIFESAAVTFSALSSLPTPYSLLETYGFNAQLMQNILFTCLQVSVGMNAFWCYRLGIFHNNMYIEKQQPFLLGIGGDSGVGKSTFTDRIRELVGKNQLLVLNGDDSHKWERHDEKWQYMTHLNPKANNIHNDVRHMYALINGKTIERTTYNHKTGKFSKPTQIEKNQFIVFQGLHPFFLDTMRDLYNLKIYIEAEESLRKQWKTNRDTKERGHSAATVSKHIANRKKDASKFILPQKKSADWIIRYYALKKQVCVTYTFSNTIPLDELLHELSEVKGLTIKHEYKNLKLQTVSFEGKINKTAIMKIAYKLYPDINTLINHQPEFRENIQGINQLFFINYLNYYFANTTTQRVIPA